MSDEPRYSVGDLAVDREQDPEERTSVVVLRYLRDADDEGDYLTAANHAPPALDGATVADVNPDGYADDRVVEVLFQGWLDGNVPEWRDLLDDARELDRSFYSLLVEFGDEWGIPTVGQVYAYPERRLIARPWCESCYEKAEWVDEADDYECTNPMCTDPAVVQTRALHALDEVTV